ncbi:MAG: hypothetical protein K0V04_36755, partial [Deltaproteobacteria bacterium]|nr:hypothetical protein [Deltaproteobacteria bacterium]
MNTISRAMPTAWTWLRWIVAAAAVVWVAGGVPGRSEARLRPYYVLQSATGSVTVKPRILFVLDTSGSMALRSGPNLDTCAWEECESPATEGTNLESRIAAARRAVQNVTEATSDSAKFALMTFQQNDAHSSNRRPSRCRVGNSYRRFVWVEWVGYIGWQQIRRDGHRGAWRLCQGNQIRPFPYLRWDNLGAGSVISGNNQSGEVPPSPLIGTSYNQITSSSNANRSVQWFPEFMGIRFSPNDDTDPGRAITHASVGDYGTRDWQKDANVWGHDFYYWPYVDGFPG